VDIGAHAWHLGGINCMRQLRDMAMENAGPAKTTDYISYWWDGIGTGAGPHSISPRGPNDLTACLIRRRFLMKREKIASVRSSPYY